MNMTLREANDYLQSRGWNGTLMFYPELYLWNKNATVEEAYVWFQRHRQSCFEVEKAEFQARHSALSPEAAKAYADNWN